MEPQTVTHNDLCERCPDFETHDRKAVATVFTGFYTWRVCKYCAAEARALGLDVKEIGDSQSAE